MLVWSRTAENAARFAAATTAETGLTVKVMASAEEVVRSADVVCALTATRTPTVCGAWFAPELHVNAVGPPPRGEYREIDSDGIARSRVIVDSFEAALAESGDMLVPLHERRITRDHFRDELGQVIIGSRPGRQSTEEITLYNSFGVGIQDIAARNLAVKLARQAGLEPRSRSTDAERGPLENTCQSPAAPRHHATRMTRCSSRTLSSVSNQSRASPPPTASTGAPPAWSCRGQRSPVDRDREATACAL